MSTTDQIREEGYADQSNRPANADFSHSWGGIRVEPETQRNFTAVYSLQR